MNRLAALAFAAALLAPATALPSDHPAPAAPNPDAVLKQLKAGNARFVAGKSTHPDGSVGRRKELTKGQAPKAVVLGCSDSRVPPELIFDEGLGDLFVVRVAGNVADPVNLGSVEYAAEHLGTGVVVVLGHHACGAVKATAESGGKAEGNIGAIVAEIAPAVEQAKASPGKEGLLDDSSHANARRAAAALTERSPVLKHLVEEGKLKIAVAVYDLASGKVEFE
ncbi:MAG TPA: carbonic anhydrase [Anaeromyxobacteraceae bacterium]|nr:carbonic anhydrase [Anaeromyxobacteraceae bacterium]